MSGRNGERRPPRPRIEMLTDAEESEAAAIVGALERFMADMAPAPAASGHAQSAWQRVALEEGIAARQVSGRGWGATVARRPGSG